MESSQIESKKTLFRDSNMELHRIICMVMVMVCHADYMSLGGPTQADVITHGSSTFLKMLIFSSTVLCLNCFILISGWYGIRPKLKRFFSLLFQVLFVCGISLLLYTLFFPHKLDITDLKSLLLLTDDLWFVKAYIILYLLSPALNAFCQWANQRQYLLTLAGLFIFQTIYGWYSSSVIWIDGGYSPYSFIFLYLLARYFRLYPGKLTNQTAFFYISCCVMVILIATSVNFLSLRYGIGEGMSWFSLISPFIILESVLFTLFFSKLSFKSKIVNWIANSCFAVYLFHCTPITLNEYCNQVRHFHSDGNYIAICLMIIVVYIVSILIDKVRISVWKYLSKTRKQH